MTQTRNPSMAELSAAERVAPADPFTRPRPEGSPRLSVALIYPNSYHIGMSSLGFQLVYRLIEAHGQARAERFFVDTMDQGSIESGAPLHRFDVIALSGSFEMDDPSILAILDCAGVEQEAARRTPDLRRPLILMGGVLVSVNRLPLYPFIDVFLHGDAEMILPGVLDALAGESESPVGESRARLEALAGLPGVEVTAGALHAAELDMPASLDAALAVCLDPDAARNPGERIEVAPPPRATLGGLASHPSTTRIISPHTEFADMVLVDLARGCPHHCTFCWIGHNSPPYRARPIDSLIAAIEPWTSVTDRFGLVSSAVGAHEEIDEICEWMTRRELRVSYSSLRVEEVTPVMLETLVRGGQRSITIAPEAGNRRVRRLLGKTITDDQIMDVVGRAMSLGVENVKLYFMIGIPSETEEEALDIARFAERVREPMLHWGRSRGRMGTLGVNLGVFVPKPNLPLNHIEPSPLEAVKSRLRRVVRALNRIPNTRVNVSSPDLAAAQSVLSMGGVEAARYTRLVHAGGGAWKNANRAWKAEFGEHEHWRRSLSRTPAGRVRRDVEGVAAR